MEAFHLGSRKTAWREHGLLESAQVALAPRSSLGLLLPPLPQAMVPSRASSFPDVPQGSPFSWSHYPRQGGVGSSRRGD